MIALSFDELVAMHAPALQPLALALTRDRHAANDLCQETLFKALRFRDSYVHDTSMKAWLQTIMRNIFINEHRRRAKGRKVLAEVSNAIANEFNRGEAAVRLNEIQRAIHRLPSASRTACLLYLHGYRYHEIASSLNKSVGTIKSRIHYAKEALEKQLNR